MNFLDRSICSAAFANAIAFSAAVMALACLNTSTFAQDSEIEIVNQDGERVEGAKLMVGPEAGQVELDDVTDTDQRVDNFLLKSEDGKLTYTDDEGQ